MTGQSQDFTLHPWPALAFEDGCVDPSGELPDRRFW
jgi:hypothetical protein